MMKAHQQGPPVSKRILELNAKHVVVKKLEAIFKKDPKDPKLADFAYLLYGQGVMTEGSPLPDAARYARLVSALMV